MHVERVRGGGIHHGIEAVGEIYKERGSERGGRRRVGKIVV